MSPRLRERLNIDTTSDVGTLLKAAQGIADAVAHWHSSNGPHGGICPQSLEATTNTVSLRPVPRDQQPVPYQAPEVFVGRPSGPAGDLYSLGTLLYELFTGDAPFSSPDSDIIAFSHVNVPASPPSRHAQGLPAALDHVILELLEKNPSERPSSAAAVATTLADVRENLLDGMTSSSRGAFVGRRKEIGRLVDRLDDAADGRCQIQLIVGEPGIGKSRLVEEFAAIAGRLGALVLGSRCHEDEGAPAFWPWSQILRDYISQIGRDEDPASAAAHALRVMGPSAEVLATIAPDMRALAPDLGDPPELSPEKARFRLFDSVTGLLRDLSEESLLVVSLDDLHWADKPSLLLLQFIARQLTDARLLILGTYRDVEIRRDHPLAATLDALRREEHVGRLALSGVSERDVARFVELALGSPPSRSLVTALWEQTGGNPFYVSEIVTLLAEDLPDGAARRALTQGNGGNHGGSGDTVSAGAEESAWQFAIPEGVRETIGRRLDRISPQANEILEAAAVCGTQFDLDVTSRVMGISFEAGIALLDEGIGARLVESVSPNLLSFRFTHSLLRETLYEELPLLRRVRLHGEIGRALEEKHGTDSDAHLAELAHHFSLAYLADGDVLKAMEYCTRAGDAALRGLAYEDAAEHYERALSACELLKPPSDSKRAGLLLRLGDAVCRAGDTQKAQEAFSGAADIGRRVEDDELLGEAALGYSAAMPVMTAGETRARGIHLLEEALSDERPREPSPLTARLLGKLAQSLYWVDDPERRDRLSLEAVEMARGLEDPATLAFALNSRHWALDPREHEARLQTTDELIAAAERSGSQEVLLEGLRWKTLAAIEGGDPTGADENLDRYGIIADQLRQPSLRWYTPMLRAVRALMEGRFEDSERLAEDARALGYRAQLHVEVENHYYAFLFVLREDQGRCAETVDFTGRFSRAAPVNPTWMAAHGQALAAAGRQDEAAAILDHLARDDFRDLPRVGRESSRLTFLADLAVAVGDVERARLLMEPLVPFADTLVVIGAAACYGAVAQRMGEIARLCGDTRDAERYFAQARDLHRRARMPRWVDRSEHSLISL